MTDPRRGSAGRGRADGQDARGQGRAARDDRPGRSSPGGDRRSGARTPRAGSPGGAGRDGRSGHGASGGTGRGTSGGTWSPRGSTDGRTGDRPRSDRSGSDRGDRPGAPRRGADDWRDRRPGAERTGAGWRERNATPDRARDGRQQRQPSSGTAGDRQGPRQSSGRSSGDWGDRRPSGERSPGSWQDRRSGAGRPTGGSRPYRDGEGAAGRARPVDADRRDRRPSAERTGRGRDDAARGPGSWADRRTPQRRDEAPARGDWRERRPQGDRPARTGGGAPGARDGRPQRPGSPTGRPDRAGGQGWRDRRPTEDRRPRPEQDRTPPATPGPEVPEWADARDLDPGVRAALRGLDSRNAEKVARHLVVAGTLVDEDPELALGHARAARDRASRIAVVREAVGVAAYHAGDFAEASRELRAYRRMSGEEGYRAVLADCERAQGRPEVALRLVREALADGPDPDETVELRLVEAGARRDLGETAAARLVLEGALGGRPTPTGLDLAEEGTRRLASAYADLLSATGDPAADTWREAVSAASPDEDVAFGEEDAPGEEEVEAEAPADHHAEDGTTGAPHTGTATEEPEDADTAEDDLAGDGLDEHELPGDGVDSGVDFDEDVEREVAELLGEVDPPAADQPGH